MVATPSAATPNPNAIGNATRNMSYFERYSMLAKKAEEDAHRAALSQAVSMPLPSTAEADTQVAPAQSPAPPAAPEHKPMTRREIRRAHGGGPLRSNGGSSSSSSSSGRETSSPVLEVIAMLRASKAADWKSRLRCFVKLNDFLQAQLANGSARALFSREPDGPGGGGEGGGKTATAHGLRFEKIARAVAGSLPDAHHKVTLAAMGALRLLFECTPKADNPAGVEQVCAAWRSNPFAAHLGLLLPGCFTGLVDGRSAIREAAAAILSAVKARADSNELVLALVNGIFDHPNQKCRLGCQEFVLALIPPASAGLASRSAMRQAVHKTAENLRSNNATLRRASLHTLIALHNVHARLFLDQLQTVHTSLRDRAITALAGSIPRLRQALIANARVSNSQRVDAAKAAAHAHHANNGNDGNNPAHTGGGPRSSLRRPPVPSSRRRRAPPPPPAAGAPPPAAASSSQTLTASSPSQTPVPIRQTGSKADQRRARQQRWLSVRGGAPGRAPGSSGRGGYPGAAALATLHDIPNILASLAAHASPAVKARGLVRVSHLSRDIADAAHWEVLFPQIVIAVVGTLRAQDASTRVHALMCLRSMLETHPLPFAGLVDVVLGSVLEACRDGYQDVMSSAGTTLLLMAQRLDSEQCARAVVPIVCAAAPTPEDAQGPLLRVALRTLQMFVPVMSSGTVYEVLPELMPPVLRAISSPESAIRKEAVFLFVRVYAKVGQAHAEPWMALLTLPQQRLVTIYIERAAAKVEYAAGR